MTNTLALILATLIIGFFALDYFVLHLDAGPVLLRKIIELIQILAFWR